MGEKLIGDPLEISILDDLEWTLKGDHVMPLNKKTSPINTFKIEKKFHFSSALARMSTIVCQSDSNKYYAVVKGSAEKIKKRLSNVPSWYDKCHKSLARDGHRCRVSQMCRLLFRPPTLCRDGPLMIAITFMIGTIYDCNLHKKVDQI